jgi:hypothetical protein
MVKGIWYQERDKETRKQAKFMDVREELPPQFHWASSTRQQRCGTQQRCLCGEAQLSERAGCVCDLVLNDLGYLSLERLNGNRLWPSCYAGRLWVLSLTPSRHLALPWLASPNHCLFGILHSFPIRHSLHHQDFRFSFLLHSFRVPECQLAGGCQPTCTSHRQVLQQGAHRAERPILQYLNSL